MFQPTDNIRVLFREYAAQPQVDEITSNNEAINQLHLEDNATVGPGKLLLMVTTTFNCSY